VKSPVRITAGVATAVYSDEALPILQALGKVEITRATDVEWDEEAGEWIARLRSTGEIIAHGQNRRQVIQGEVAVLEARIREGRDV
jgi:hypothetical protein